MNNKTVKGVLILIMAAIFAAVMTTCGDSLDSGTLTINLGTDARAATGFNGAVDSKDLSFNITLTNNQTGETRNAVINSDGTRASATGLSLGNWDINVDAEIFGYPYGKGEVKSFPVIAGQNDVSVTMERLPDAIVLSTADGESHAFPNTVYLGSTNQLVIDIYNYTDKASLDFTANLSADGFLLSSNSLNVPQDDKGQIIITTVTDTIGVFDETLTISGPGGIIANIELSSIIYPPPGIITTAEEFNAIRGNLSGSYILDNDIDLSGYPNWKSIGSNTSPFAGTFDGNGHIISNLTINTTDTEQGLFGNITGTVKNLGLKNAAIITQHGAGGIAGWNVGTIQNCFAEVDIDGVNNSGGIAGRNAGIIENSYSTGIIRTSTGINTGGIVGRNALESGSTITYIKNCYSTATIIAGSNYSGGILGRDYNNRIDVVQNCAALNLSVSGSSYAGRVIGPHGGIDNYARADMQVNGNTVTGGTTANNNGADITPTDWETQVWWTGTVNWIINNTKAAASESSPWWWDSNRPKLWFE